MPKKILTHLVFGLFGLTTAFPAVAQAQETATLALKNGERPSGQLIDLGAAGFILRVNGDERRVPLNDVAAVEFVGGPLPPAAAAKVAAGEPIVLMRNGQIIDGRLSDIGGTHPLRLTVETAAGPRDFSSNDVAQVILAPLNGRGLVEHPPSGGAPPAGQASTPPATPGAITVPANQAWTNTAVGVLRGQRISFTARGTISIAANVSSGPDGNPAGTVRSGRYPIPGVSAGALIGRVGNQLFPIGSNTESIAMPTNGILMLGINDDTLGDNSGSYSVSLGSDKSGTGSRRRR
jgi:hypothetical protein